MGKESGGRDVGSFSRLLSRIVLVTFDSSCPQPTSYPFLSLSRCGINMVGEGRQKNLAKWRKEGRREGKKGGREEGREEERKLTFPAALSQVIK